MFFLHRQGRLRQPQWRHSHAILLTVESFRGMTHGLGALPQAVVKPLFYGYHQTVYNYCLKLPFYAKIMCVNPEISKLRAYLIKFIIAPV